MMEQKLKEEEERKRKKEMEERMSLEETKEQVCWLIYFKDGVIYVGMGYYFTYSYYFFIVRFP